MVGSILLCITHFHTKWFTQTCQDSHFNSNPYNVLTDKCKLTAFSFMAKYEWVWRFLCSKFHSWCILLLINLQVFFLTYEIHFLEEYLLYPVTKQPDYKENMELKMSAAHICDCKNLKKKASLRIPYKF